MSVARRFAEGALSSEICPSPAISASSLVRLGPSDAAQKALRAADHASGIAPFACRGRFTGSPIIQSPISLSRGFVLRAAVRLTFPHSLARARPQSKHRLAALHRRSRRFCSLR